jgi:hypothetical protein
MSQADMVLQWVKVARARKPKHSPSPETMLVRDALKLYDELGVDDCGYTPFALSVAKQAGAYLLESNIRCERQAHAGSRCNQSPRKSVNCNAVQSDFKKTLIA